MTGYVDRVLNRVSISSHDARDQRDALQTEPRWHRIVSEAADANARLVLEDIDRRLRALEERHGGNRTREEEIEDLQAMLDELEAGGQ